MNFDPDTKFSTSFLAALSMVCLSGCAAFQKEQEQPAPASAPVTEEVVVAEPVVAKADEPVEEIVLPVTPVEPSYEHDDVVWIQQRLQQLGYYEGGIDGSVGSATRNAIKAYQQDQGLQGDGKPTSKFRDFMWRNGG